MGKSLTIKDHLKNEAIQKYMEENKRYQELLEKNKIESEKNLLRQLKEKYGDV